MSGVFPNSGVAPTDAQNSLLDPNTVNCDELWYSTSRCQPRFDAAAANAMVSEIINLATCFGAPYDCLILDNLCTMLKGQIAILNAKIAALDNRVDKVEDDIDTLQHDLNVLEQRVANLEAAYDKLFSAMSIFVSTVNLNLPNDPGMSMITYPGGWQQVSSLNGGVPHSYPGNGVIQINETGYYDFQAIILVSGSLSSGPSETDITVQLEKSIGSGGGILASISQRYVDVTGGGSFTTTLRAFWSTIHLDSGDGIKLTAASNTTPSGSFISMVLTNASLNIRKFPVK